MINKKQGPSTFRVTQRVFITSLLTDLNMNFDHVLKTMGQSEEVWCSVWQHKGGITVRRLVGDAKLWENSEKMDQFSTEALPNI